MDITTPLSRHQRAALPKRGSPVFFYKTQPRLVPAPACQVVVRCLEQAISERGIGRGEIEMFSAKSLRHLGGDEVAQAWDEVEQALLLPGGRLELLVCEYARPHSDTSYAGKGFVSTVLHTGPQPYVVDVFTTSRAVEGGLEVNARTRVLSAGDTFVLDPTIPHSATPVRPQAGCLLVLAQQEVPLACRADYEVLLRLLPREATDRDITMLDWT